MCSRLSARSPLSAPAAPRLLAVLLGVLSSGALSGCGRPDCAGMEAGDARDNCYFEEMAVAADKDRLDEATAAVESISSPLSRAAAVRKLIAANPRGLTDDKAKALCGKLQGDDATACLRTWDRPHLWKQ